MDAHLGEATLPFPFLLPFLVRVASERKEFALQGKDSFLKGFCCPGKQTESQMLFPFIKMAEKYGKVYPLS